MVLMSQRDGLGSASQAPRDVQAGPGKPQTYPRWGSEVEHRGPTRNAARSEVGSECTVRHLPGSKAGQGVREKTSHPRTGPCCPLAKGEGDGSVETGSRALPSSPSWDPEKKETALFLRFWVPLAGEPVAEQNKKREQNILHPALLRGKEWCGHHLLKSRIQRLRVARLRNAACPGASRAWQGQRRAAPLSCGQLHAVAVVKAAAEAELERR